jgi:hypothetical protein
MQDGKLARLRLKGAEGPYRVDAAVAATADAVGW